MREIVFPPGYERAAPRSEEEVMAEMDRRCGNKPSVVRTVASTPLAPPPEASRLDTKVTTQVGVGFVLNGMIRKADESRAKRQVTPRPEQIDRSACRHKSGWTCAGAYFRDRDKMRVACRACGFKQVVTKWECDVLVAQVAE